MRASVLAATLVAGSLLVHDIPTARACGCLSPPAVTEGDFAVNQQSEQIIFEVEPGWVTAHVMIQYAGDPAAFAWIVPVPEVPELGISSATAFGIIDQQTRPDVSVETQNLCPISEWACAYHDQPYCHSFFDGYDEASPGYGYGGADAGTSSSDAAGSPPVTVLDEQVVGDYQTVTFRANEASAATQWLRDNGFVVNQTTSIYMESYVQQNMVFVAAKLVPGAGVRAIKPLRLRYRSDFPMVPLILTAVAAEPHLTVTSYIYSSTTFRPQGHPTVTIDAKRIALDPKGRLNYPMVLSRTIDEAGGDAFAIEFAGSPSLPQIGNGMCCGFTYDACNVHGDGQCQCPGDDYDADDCATKPDLVDGVKLVERLYSQYNAVTRITTRVSAEEMTFDPTFEPDYDNVQSGRLTLRGQQSTLAGCGDAVIDHDTFVAIDAKQTCAATYCGPGGTCVVTTSGPACACNTDFVAQRFTDLDGIAAVTCVPKTPPVDLRANGEQLPNACKPGMCGAGTCIDRNGVAVCTCSTGAAAAAGFGTAPTCETVIFTSSSPGAEDYSDGLAGLPVCAPAPPACGEDGWLVRHDSPRPGVDCGGTQPAKSLTIPGPKPTCGGAFGCSGCEAPGGSAPMSSFFTMGLVGLALMSRRRTRSR